MNVEKIKTMTVVFMLLAVGIGLSVSLTASAENIKISDMSYSIDGNWALEYYRWDGQLISREDVEVEVSDENVTIYSGGDILTTGFIVENNQTNLSEEIDYIIYCEDFGGLGVSEIYVYSETYMVTNPPLCDGCSSALFVRDFDNVSLDFDISVNNSYKPGEQINVIVNLKNIGNSSVTLSEMMLIAGSLDLYITTPDGKYIQYIGDMINCFAPHMTLEPGEVSSVVVDITDENWPFGESYEEPYDFITEGYYEIYGVYSSSNISCDENSTGWGGMIHSVLHGFCIDSLEQGIIQGRVIEGSYKRESPLVNVKVTATSATFNYITYTDRSGFYRLFVDPSIYNLTFSLEGYENLSVYCGSIEAGEIKQKNVSLFRKATLSGHVYRFIECIVVSPNESVNETEYLIPISNAKVTLLAPIYGDKLIEDISCYSPYLREVCSTFTDENGGFVFEDLNPENYVVKVTKCDYQTEFEVVTLQSGDEKDIVFYMHHAPEIHYIRESNNGCTVYLQKGFQLNLTLAARPSTGYSWEIVHYNKQLLRLVDHFFWGNDPIYTDDNMSVQIDGAPVKETWIFEAIGDGETKLMLKQFRSWEPLNVIRGYSVNVHIGALDLKILGAIGRVKLAIRNTCDTDIGPVYWDIEVKDIHSGHRINVSASDFIDELESFYSVTVSTGLRSIVRKFGFVKIVAKVTIPVLGGEPIQKTETAYGFVCGRIVKIVDLVPRPL